ncbi:unnamed protein product [Arabidopsis halleri]
MRFRPVSIQKTIASEPSIRSLQNFVGSFKTPIGSFSTVGFGIGRVI